MNSRIALVLIRQRQNELGQEPSVIISYSGSDDAASHAGYLQLGFDRCFPKPCNREELLAALRPPVHTERDQRWPTFGHQQQPLAHGKT